MSKPAVELEHLLIRGGRVIDPGRDIDAKGDIYIAGGRVVRLDLRGTAALPDNCPVLNADGLVVCPGFIDLHCHLRQPGFEDAETIATGTRAAARGGFTTVCCMPNTEPPIDTAGVVELVRSIAGSEGVVRVLPVGCVSKHRAGKELADFGELSLSGVIGFSDDGSPVADASLMKEALRTAREVDLPVIDHCEDPALSMDGVINEGETARRLGLKGISRASEESVVARDIEIARTTGGRLHVAHVSAAGSADLIRRARSEGLAVTAEVTPHHLTLTEEEVGRVGPSARVNPPLRTQDDIDALIEALEEGVLDAIATDHAPHTARDKDGEFSLAASGISGFETALGSLMGLVHTGSLGIKTLLARLTSGPAGVLRRADIGTLKPGSVADIVVFDPRIEWVVDPADFISMGRNTPLAGRTLRGRVICTLVGGHIAYKDYVVKMRMLKGLENINA
ncbi:MAG: dihydroorotase [Dehalococcoidia bacterium]|nr:dihydroorotase [Dehalococcoidia bacterium]